MRLSQQLQVSSFEVGDGERQLDFIVLITWRHGDREGHNAHSSDSLFLLRRSLLFVFLYLRCSALLPLAAAAGSAGGSS